MTQLRRNMIVCTAVMLAFLPAVAGAADISDGVIKIGVLTDVVGPYAQSSGQGSQVAAELAAEEFGGKIHGAPIKILLGDHQNKGDVAAAKVKEWHEKERIDMVTDMPTSATAIAVHQYTKETGIVTVVTGAASESLTGRFCSATGIHWQMSTTALAVGVAEAVSESSQGKTWYLITVDHAFGRAIYDKINEALKPHGGKIIGATYTPFNETQYFQHLQKALASGADVIAVANGGKPVIEAIRQAKEISPDKPLVSVLTLLQDIRALGLYTAGGTRFMAPYYWDFNDASRAFTERFKKRTGSVPSSDQISIYTGTLHYLKAVQQSGRDKGVAVTDAMKRIPINDGITQNGKLRPDGRMVHDIHFMEVKRPIESAYAMDYYKLVRTVPGERAFEPPTGDCPYVSVASR